MTLTTSVPLRPVCRHPGCNQPPHGGSGEPGEWCPTHLQRIQAIRVAVHQRAMQNNHRGGMHPPTECGTEKGYVRHRRKREDTCADCVLAHNTYSTRPVTPVNPTGPPRHPWVRRCHRRHCNGAPTWQVTYRNSSSEALCGRHAAECAFHGAGVLTPIEAVERRYQDDDDELGETAA